MYNHDNMGEQLKKMVKSCGKDVKIFPLVKIVNPQAVEIGDFSMIDDFTFINAGKGIKIGRYVHIASFVSIIGSGELEIGDYADIACGVRILTATDTYYYGKKMSSALPPEQRHVIRGKIVIGKDAFIGTNAVIHPNVTIGEGAIIGSNSLVLKSVEPWTINSGSPCIRTGDRPEISVPDL